MMQTSPIRAMKILAMCLCLASPAFAQDDCPTGHVRHPPVSALDHESMLSAYKASFRGLFGRDPSMQPGAGKDDGEYYIGAANHYGVYGDDQCHAGWSGYWESWLRDGRGDLTLVDTPARFLPYVAPPPVVMPPPVAVPPPVSPPPIIIQPPLDLSGVQRQLDVLLQEVRDGRAENKTFFENVKSVWAQIGAPLLKYVLPAVAAFVAGKKL